jgi:hypothetical protein
MRHDNHMIPYLFEQKLVLIVLRTQYLMNGAHHGNMRSFICSERSAIVAKGELEFGLPGFTGRNADQSSASSDVSATVYSVLPHVPMRTYKLNIYLQ